MLLPRSSSSRLLILLFNCLVFGSTPPQSTAQDRSLGDAPSANLQPISTAALENAVRNGQWVVGHIIHSSQIKQVLESDKVNTRNAQLRIRNARIVGETVRLTGPVKPVDQYPKDYQEHFSKYNVSQPVHVAIPIQILDSVFDADINLMSIVFENDLTFENVEFRRSVYFQRSIFQTTVIFRQGRFKEISDFSGMLFLDAVTFDGCEFAQQANFSNGNIGADGKIYFTGSKLDVPLDFSNSIIRGRLTLEGLAQPFQVTNTIYLNGVNSKQTPSGELHLKNVEVSNNIYLDRSRWVVLDFAEGAEGMHRPIRFDGFCDLRDGYFIRADFAGAEFGHGGDFAGARFDIVSFQRTKIREPIRIDWSQLNGRLKRIPDNQPLDQESYRQIELNFKNLNDLRGENEARYQRRTIWEGRCPISFWLTGYWVRPKLILGWLAGFFGFFSFINLFAFRGQWFRDRPPRNTLVGAMPPSIQVALHAAALKPTVPSGVQTTKWGECLFYIEYIIFKFIELCVVIVVSNTSPLLKQIVPYFFPG